MATRAVAGEGRGGGGRGALWGGGRPGAPLPPPPPHPPGRVEPDISSLWMDLFSLDSVIFVVDFSGTYLMTNAENSVLELPKPIPPYKASPIPPYKSRAFGTRDNVPPLPPPPYYKESSYGPGRSSQ